MRIKMRFKSARVSRAASWMETGTTTVRSWDELNYDVLVDIIKRIPLRHRLFVLCLVSKSWLSAVLESLSPSGVINLKVLDSPHNRVFENKLFYFLKRMLDNKPADFWSTLILGEKFVQSKKYAYIAKRTPFLQKLVISSAVGWEYAFMLLALHYWKKLKQVECPVPLIKVCPGSFSMVESLRLFGIVDDSAALVIRDRCPRLKQLMLISCALSMNALSVILDGHKKLELLDTSHSFRVSHCKHVGKTGNSISLVEWNEEEIRHKAAGIKLHLRCAQERCAQCAKPIKCCFPDQIENRGLPIRIGQTIRYMYPRYSKISKRYWAMW